MGVPMRSYHHISHPHYAMIYLDNTGKVKVDESASIRDQNMTVFSSEVRQRFLDVLGAKIGYHRPMFRRGPGFRETSAGFSYGGYHDDWSSLRQVKRRKPSVNDHSLDMSFGTQFSEPIQELPPYTTTDKVPLEIGDTEKVLAYYESALKHFQQLNCRHIAKAFIKFIEPRKQVKHPYNGGRPPVGSAPGEKGDPEKTKPEWWPAGVVHKEPDHLKKAQRLRLLIHILRKLGKYNITSEKLQEVAHDAKRQIKPLDKLEILDEIFRVRKLEERYERGEVDSTHFAYVVNRDTNPKPEKDKDSDSVSEPDHKLEMDDEDAEDDLLTSVTSADHTAPPMPTPIDHMSMAAPSRPLPMGGDRAPMFSMSESLSFGDQPRDRSYFPSEYADDFSTQNLLKTPATSTIVSPNEQPAAFDYLSQPSFSSTTTEDSLSHHRQPPLPVQQPTSHYDAWAPSFRQSVFGSVDYTPSQALAQPSLHYQMPVTHPHDIPHGLPDLCRTKPTHLDPTPSFRTGSLSHPNFLHPHHGNSA
ncbi:hypothetical protein ASPWEDRAFT_271934 [Aspergillus wentii DTO 134E9]|uniref:Subtelomeric hrmA-associated cluster protein AFUB-079030/YDR124W-like helical bundle domain-containing protein n=1 Tax=Aspergillus wentii DTO 134E9 TaxID=1073089 RepID=A0A1L9S327_ASPWE|nr:uncharacterized protein ASPWEDRAFT_271934 [Aspergillus wentii DTO 134E9]OJJ41556.1 hypothetical protein ASPWEDRAFT_271934 [Aspergillus wentii DTO 134E9]